MRAWAAQAGWGSVSGVGRVAAGIHTTSNEETHPHFCPLDLPLVSVALVSSPFGLEEVEDAGESIVLAALRWKGYFGGLGPQLLLRASGALLLQLARGFGGCECAQHGELDGSVRDGILWWRFRVDSQRRAVDHSGLFGTNNVNAVAPSRLTSAGRPSSLLAAFCLCAVVADGLVSVQVVPDVSPAAIPIISCRPLPRFPQTARFYVNATKRSPAGLAPCLGPNGADSSPHRL